MLSFTVITPTLQRDSLVRCCRSLETQTADAWQHIVVVDGGPLKLDLLNDIQHPNRQILCLDKRLGFYGNKARHIGWHLATGDYCIYLDDDNFFLRDDALADISRTISEDRSLWLWAVFPILRFGQRFFTDNPGVCHVDSANMVIQREIAQWPDREEYTLDGIFCESLKEKYRYAAFPEVAPIISVPVQGKGE